LADHSPARVEEGLREAREAVVVEDALGAATLTSRKPLSSAKRTHVAGEVLDVDAEEDDASGLVVQALQARSADPGRRGADLARKGAPTSSSY